MNGWLIVLLIVNAIYGAGFVGFYVLLRDVEERLVLSAFWPLTLFWMLVGDR